jgi:hypothetical protein
MGAAEPLTAAVLNPAGPRAVLFVDAAVFNRAVMTNAESVAHDRRIKRLFLE